MTEYLFVKKIKLSPHFEGFMQKYLIIFFFFYFKIIYYLLIIVYN